MKKIFLIMMFLTVALGFSFTNAFADGGRDRQRHEPENRRQVMVVKTKGRYHIGRLSRSALYWFAPRNRVAVGMSVVRLPYGYKTIMVHGVTYHRYNNVYYRACRSGYLVVPAPH